MKVRLRLLSTRCVIRTSFFYISKPVMRLGMMVIWN